MRAKIFSSFTDSKTLISCMKNNKKDETSTVQSSFDDTSQKVGSPQKKSLSFASSSSPCTNNSSFSKNSFEDHEGINTLVINSNERSRVPNNGSEPESSEIPPNICSFHRFGRQNFT